MRMHARRVRDIATVAVAASVLLGLLTGAAAAARPATPATFDGGTIDLAGDWGEAQACLVAPQLLQAPECFPTEAELDARLAQLAGSAKVAMNSSGLAMESTSGSSCSGYLRLYDGTNYTGQVLHISGRYQWFDLASFNFNNRTSSFRIGPCSAYFADYAGGGGPWYPTSATQAYAVAATMQSGWNNAVSSLYIT